MKNKIFLLICGLLIVFTINQVKDSFALLESNSGVDITSSIGKWNIKINNLDVKTSDNFIIDSFFPDECEGVKSGKIAPGCSGYLDVLIEPGDTDVAFRYDLGFDFSDLSDSVIIDKIEVIGGSTVVRTGEFKYSNIFSLDDISDGLSNTIRVYIKWLNIEENNDMDSSIGLVRNNKLGIKANILVSQYLGEELVPYVEESEI